MKSLQISSPTPYFVYFDKEFNNLNIKLRDIYSSDIKICIITDNNVGRIYLNELVSKLNFNNVFTYSILPGEDSKNLNAYADIIEFLSNNNFGRYDLLIAFGGGVVGDLTGFVASTYMRGIDYIQVPTTLLSQVDSSIGSKTAINIKNRKNLVGSFYNPKFVFINIKTLNTLTKKEILSGYAEIIKHAILYDPHFFDDLSKIEININHDIGDIIYKSCIIKNKVVSKDFRENNYRRHLNLGHTFGHAVEAVYSDYLSHGECVSIGIIFSAYLSYNKGFLSIESREKIIKLISTTLLNIYKVNLNIKKIINYIKYDKKNVNGNINWILINDIGSCRLYSDISKGDIFNAAEKTFERIFN